MGRIRFAVQTSHSCFRSWQSAPRVLTLLLMLICFTAFCAVPFVENANAQGEALQFGETFIALTNWRFSMLVFSTLLLLLFGDLPCVEPFTKNAILRGTRRSWIAGQLIYILLTSLLFCVLVLVTAVLTSLPNLSFANEWSRPVKLMSLANRVAVSPDRLQISISSGVIKTFLPFAALGHCFMLLFLMGTFYGMTTLVLKMRFHSAGLISIIGFNLLSWCTTLFVPQQTAYAVISMFSVHYHGSLASHDDSSLNALLPTLQESYGIFACGILLLVGLSMLFVKRYDYSDSEDLIR